MPVINDADLQDIANLAADLALKDDCDILEEVRTENESGGYDLVWTVVNTVKCMVVDQKLPQEYVIANQVVGEVIKKVSTPLGTIVLKSNRLRVKGVEYEVINSLGLSSYAVFSEVLVIVTTLPSN
jgi:hypothetical protein